MEQIRLFIGWDHREAVGGHVFIQSLIDTTRYPVSLTILTPELANDLAPADANSTNAFSRVRFLCPYLCGFKGFSLFLDGADMMLRASLADLWMQKDPHYPLKVAKHCYQTKSKTKYVGTALEAKNEDYPKKNQSSVMLFWNEYEPTKQLTPGWVADQASSYLHRFGWLPEEKIGDLPLEWNWLVGEYEYNKDAKNAHHTLGLPGFEQYRRADYAVEWTETLKRAAKGLQYLGK
jgi:hypothetical protein